VTAPATRRPDPSWRPARPTAAPCSRRGAAAPRRRLAVSAVAAAAVVPGVPPEGPAPAVVAAVPGVPPEGPAPAPGVAVVVGFGPPGAERVTEQGRGPEEGGEGEAGGGGGGGAAGGAVGAASACRDAAGGWLAEPSEMTARRAPTSTVSPSATRISESVPVAGAGTSESTLSVETSKSGSSRLTGSPIAFIQRVIVPSVTVSPSCGMVTSTNVEPPSGQSQHCFTERF
jgi:hypothetical protein